MLKHLGVCRAAGGEQPLKSEGGLGVSLRAGGLAQAEEGLEVIFFVEDPGGGA